MNKHKKIKMELFENGLDFIDTSLKPILCNNNPHELKYSILHLSAGIELVLKEIIRNEHWAFIFEDINKANYDRLTIGDFQSVNFETLIKRLTSISPKKIPNYAIDEIRQLRKIRNKMEHFAFEVSPEALRSHVSKVLCEVLDLIRQNIYLTHYNDNINIIFTRIKAKSFDFEEYVKLKTDKIKDEIKTLESNNVKIIKCPNCLQAALPFNKDLKCLFCDHQGNTKELAYHYSYCVLNEEFNDDDACPKCYQHTIAINGENAICFNCCDEFDISYYPECIICSNKLFHDEENSVCYSCLSKENPDHEKY